MGGHSRAIVVDSNRSVARRVARVLVSAGYKTELREPGEGLSGLSGMVEDPTGALLIGDAEVKEEIVRALPALGPALSLVLYSGGELDAAALLEEANPVALLAHRGGAGRLELETELLGLARHLRGAPLPPLQGLLQWGAQAFSAEIHNTAGRDAAAARVVSLCSDELCTSRRVADGAGEVVHELLTNAIYDAPIDEQGALRHNRDRTANIELLPAERVTFRFGTDGLRLAIEVEDRFGRLRRRDLCRSLRRGAAGRVHSGDGGAGIGLWRVLRTCQSLLFDVEPGRRTRVTAILELDPPRSEGGGARKGQSLIFPERGRTEAEPGGGGLAP